MFEAFDLKNMLGISTTKIVSKVPLPHITGLGCARSNLQLAYDCLVLNEKCSLGDFVYMLFSTRRAALVTKIPKVLSSKSALTSYFS